MSIDTDQQYEEHKITSVERSAKGWTVSMDSCGIFVPAEACKQPPVAGETMRLYGRGFGYPVRGIAINGRVYRYRTATQAEQDHRDQVTKAKQERAAAYEAKRAAFDARVAALSEPLRLRIERFRAMGGDPWRYEFESYELFTCEQAAVIAEAVVTLDELQRFHALKYDEQRKRVPKLDEGHSGNTFGAACNLARGLIDRPDLVPKMHGAMCALVGCADYGCFAGHEARRGIEA